MIRDYDVAASGTEFVMDHWSGVRGMRRTYTRLRRRQGKFSEISSGSDYFWFVVTALSCRKTKRFGIENSYRTLFSFNVVFQTLCYCYGWGHFSVTTIRIVYFIGLHRLITYYQSNSVTHQMIPAENIDIIFYRKYCIYFLHLYFLTLDKLLLLCIRVTFIGKQ